jgi:hypothetical protein
MFVASRGWLSNDFRLELTFPGISISPSFVPEPQKDGVAEQLIDTLEADLHRGRQLATVAEPAEARCVFGRDNDP